MSTFFYNIFSNQQCGFRKGYSTQHCFLVRLETWKKSVDKGKVFDALLKDLSKPSDVLIKNYLQQNQMHMGLAFLR